MDSSSAPPECRKWRSCSRVRSTGASRRLLLYTRSSLNAHKLPFAALSKQPALSVYSRLSARSYSIRLDFSTPPLCAPLRIWNSERVNSASKLSFSVVRCNKLHSTLQFTAVNVQTQQYLHLRRARLQYCTVYTIYSIQVRASTCLRAGHIEQFTRTTRHVRAPPPSWPASGCTVHYCTSTDAP